MKPDSRILPVLLILFSLIGYLEWGGGNRAFVFQAEADILMKLFRAPSEVTHAMTILPLTGQILLVWAFFTEKNRRKLIITGGALISILMILIFFVGAITLKFKILLSPVPFLIIYIYSIFNKAKGNVKLKMTPE